MSLRAMAYVKELTEDAAGVRLKTTEKFVLLILADYHNPHRNVAWPDLPRLARECLLSKRALITVLANLQRRGLLGIVHQDNGAGWSIRNAYTLPGLPSPRGEETSPLPQDVGGEVSISRGEVLASQGVKFSTHRGEVFGGCKDDSYLRTVEENLRGETAAVQPPTPTPQGVGSRLSDSERAAAEWIMAEWGAIPGVLHPARIVPGHGIDKAIAVKLRKHPDRAWWRELFDIVCRSPWLCGEVEPGPGKTRFRATLGWVLLPSNLAKILQGDYRRLPGDRLAVRGKFSSRGTLAWVQQKEAARASGAAPTEGPP